VASGCLPSNTQYFNAKSKLRDCAREISEVSFIKATLVLKIFPSLLEQVDLLAVL